MTLRGRRERVRPMAAKTKGINGNDDELFGEVKAFWFCLCTLELRTICIYSLVRQKKKESPIFSC